MTSRRQALTNLASRLDLPLATIAAAALVAAVAELDAAEIAALAAEFDRCTAPVLTRYGVPLTRANSSSP